MDCHIEGTLQTLSLLLFNFFRIYSKTSCSLFSFISSFISTGAINANLNKNSDIFLASCAEPCCRTLMCTANPSHTSRSASTHSGNSLSLNTFGETRTATMPGLAFAHVRRISSQLSMALEASFVKSSSQERSKRACLRRAAAAAVEMMVAGSGK